MIGFFNIMKQQKGLHGSGNVYKLDGNANELNLLSVPNNTLYAPTCWYANGRTYLAHRKKHHSGVDGRAGIIQYYEGGITNAFMPNGPSSIDYHDNPTLTIDSDGKIFLFHEQHIMDRVDVWVTANPYDINSFEYQQLSPLVGDYPKVFKINNTSYFIIGRRGLPNLRITPYNGEVFGTPVQATAADEDGTNFRHYLFGLINGFTTQDGCFHLKIAKRIFVDVQHYNKFYHVKIKPDDIYRWYNIDETYSRKIDTEGHLTETILDANYKYVDNETPGTGGGGIGIVNKSVVKQVNIIDNQVRLYTYQNGWSYNQNADISTKTTMIMRSNNVYYSLEKDGNDLNLYETNLNNIFIFKQKLLTSDTGIFQINVPYNLDEIPIGQKFAIFVGGFKNGSTNVVNGSLQNDIHIIEMIK